MRWKVVVAVMALGFAASVGCKQQCFMTADDLKHYQAMGETALESDPGPGIVPSVSHIGAPATVLDSDRPIRYMTLAEAIAIALEQGNSGNFFPFLGNTPGQLRIINDVLATFGGPGSTAASSILNPAGENNIRVLALQPAIIGTNIESALSKFDTRWVNNITWTTTDQPVANALQTIQSAITGGVPVIAQDQANATTGLIKPLPTGGIAGITFNQTYLLSNLRQAVNPAYQPTLTFSFEQPLLQGFGVEINQLRPAHPNSILNQFPSLSRTEGILITRVRFDEQRADFERQVNIMLGNVELLYWNLYGTYWQLYAREQALRQSYEAWKINKARFEAGRIPVQDLAQSRQQYESFRNLRVQALSDLLESERQLRGILALPVEDGHRIVPVDEPTLAPYHPDWHTAVNEALALRPELILARNEVKVAQMNLILQKNSLLPDLRFVSQYGWTGIGRTMDGPLFNGNGAPNNSLRSLATGDFTNWTLGLQTTIPLGFRDANAAVRSARLNLAANYQILKEQERKAMQYLTYTYRGIFTAYEQIKILRAQREAAAVQLDARFKLYVAGAKESTLDILLESQRVWSDALRDEYFAITAYQFALVGFEFAKGTIMQHDNIIIGEGPLPACAQVRAVEHERQRVKALPIREHAEPPTPPPGAYEAGGFENLMSQLTDVPSSALPSLPIKDALKKKDPLPEIAPKPGTNVGQSSMSPKTPMASNAKPATSRTTSSGIIPVSATSTPTGRVLDAAPATPTPSSMAPNVPTLAPSAGGGN
jgi:outer membrane protein TolC